MFESIQDIIDYYSSKEVQHEKVTTQSSERLPKLCN